MSSIVNLKIRKSLNATENNIGYFDNFLILLKDIVICTEHKSYLR